MIVYCDTHVHCYEFNAFNNLLDAAYLNLNQQAARNSSTDKACYVLFFTDGKIDKTWGKVKALAESRNNKLAWSFELNEQHDLVFAQHQERTLILAPARQLNSSERLEFLLLGCDQDLPDGLSASDIIQNNQRYVVICPWGVGKWLGGRSKELSTLMARYGDAFLLGDNATRPNFWRYVPHFKQTNQPIVNGSDPLPLSSEINRIGRFGVSFEIDDGALNLADLLNSLKSPQVKKENFGELMRFIPFLKSRIKLQLQK